MTKAKLQTLVHNSWVESLYPYFQTQSFKNLSIKITESRLITEVHPKKEDIFKVFNELSIEDVKVVLLGDSPSNMTLYDGTSVSNGRAYGVNTLIVLPEESVELHKELGEPVGFDYTLNHLVDQNVLLLNCKLTSTKIDKDAHVEWYDFTKYVIEVLNKQNDITIIFKSESSKQFKSLINNKTIRIVDNIHRVSYINWKDNTPLSTIDKMRSYTEDYNDIMMNNLEKLINKPRFLPLDKIEIIPPKDDKEEEKE